MERALTRRSFTGATLAAATLPLVVRAGTHRRREALRVGFIGVGGRGTGLLHNTLSAAPDVQIAAVCDTAPAHAARAAKILTAAGRREPALYTEGEMHWEQMLERESLDAVVIATPWRWHTPMAAGAMERGVMAGVEVPCALSIDECWRLVDTTERTGVACMMMENWSFRSDNLALLNMARKGHFGEIVHVHCAHSHDCVDHWFFDRETGADRWGAEYLIRHNRSQYPTHAVGPVLSWLDIHCGDRFETLAAHASASRGINDYFARRFGPDHPSTKREYAQGDIVTCTLRTAKGRTVVVDYDMQLPRPYDNRWTLQGTHGIYNEQRESLYLVDRSPGYHEWEPFAPYEAEFRHHWWREGGVGGHGGVDGVLLREVFAAMTERRALPLSIYDSVAMSAIIELSERSIQSSGAPVEFPDFTRGGWEQGRRRFAAMD